ncbi:MAG: universal stress protein [Desulfoferrobacter sp.]
MMKLEKKSILIAVDGSQQSFDAVRYVALMLPEGQARIHLLHVLNLIPDTFWDLGNGLDILNQTTDIKTWEKQQRKRIDVFMHESRQFLLQRGFSEQVITVIVKERQIGIARDIVREARKGYHALVLGRHGLGNLKGLLFGSIANKLVSHLHQVPLWVVGGSLNPDKILIAMDASDGAIRAMEYVVDIFGGNHPELLLFHVTRGISQPQTGYEGPAVFHEDRYWLEKAEKEFHMAEKRMKTLFKQSVARLKSKGADVSRINTKIVPGVYSRAGAIFGEAQEGGYGTIVVGRRGLSRVEEFVMGRVSSKVLQLAEEMAVWVIH